MYTRDIGDSILIEVTVTEQEPFSDTSTKIDPTTIKISITDPEGNDIIDEVSMSKQNTGEYYYNWDSSDHTSLAAGDYEITIKAEEGTTVEIDDDYIRLE